MRDWLSKIPTSVFTLGLVTICPTLGLGSVIVSLNNEGSTTLHEVEVLPGGTFNVDVNLDTDQPMGWVRLAIHASASDVLDVSEVTSKAPWIGGVDLASGILGFALPPSLGFGPGSTTLGNIEISVNPGSTAGSYTMDAVDIWWTESPVIPEHWRGGPGPTFLVHILPEPSNLSASLMLGLVYCRRSSLRRTLSGTSGLRRNAR